MATTTSQIRQHLSDYLDGALAFEAFWDWLGSLKPQVTVGSPEQRLLYAIVGRFYEYDRGAWTDAQLVDLLDRLAEGPETLPTSLFAALRLATSVRATGTITHREGAKAPA